MSHSKKPDIGEITDKLRNKPLRFHRRSIRMKGYDYSLEGAYFVTIATFRRNSLFGEVVNGDLRLNTNGNIALEQWIRLHKRFPPSEFSIFVIMPNHIHGIIYLVRGAGEESQNVGAQIPPSAPTDLYIH